MFGDKKLCRRIKQGKEIKQGVLEEDSQGRLHKKE